jgi:uncharacterized lipoprotein YmbA
MNRPQGLIAALLLFGVGCASGPAPRTFVLTPPAGETSVPVADSGRPTVELQPVLLPDYLDTTDLLLRSGPHELKVSHSARWGERLSKGLTDALSAALTVRLSHDFIALDQGAEKATRQIFVNVTALDLWPDGRCVLAVDWTVFEKDTHSVVESKREVFEIPAMGRSTVDDAALVAAIARAVGELADRLAKEVLRPAALTAQP